MSETFPLDIPYSDLLVWLKERYLIPNDWPKRLEAIKQKKSEFLLQIHSKEGNDFSKIKESFAVDAELNYDQVKRLQAMILKTEEAKVKTLFGNFSSPIISNIAISVNLYEKNNVLLCEYAKLLLQYINYDIESSEKNISVFEKNISEYQSKVSDKEDFIKNAKDKLVMNLQKYKLSNEISKEFEQIIKKISSVSTMETSNCLNIVYKTVSISLTKRLTEFKDRLRSLSELLKSSDVQSAIQYYSKFYKVFYKEDLSKIYIGFLEHLIAITKNGDFAVDKGMKEVKQTDLYISVTNNESRYLELFGKVDQFKSFIKASSDIAINSTNQIDQSMSLTALLHPKIRSSIISDLLEVRNFLTQRINQAKSPAESLYSLYSDDLRVLSSEYPIDKIESMLDQILKCVELTDSQDFKFLLRMNESEKIVLKIIADIDSSFDALLKAKDDIISIKSKLEECKAQISLNMKSRDDLKKEVKNIKKNVEKTLTNLLKRKILIIGHKNLF